jgi:hypothetical protein
LEAERPLAGLSSRVQSKGKLGMTLPFISCAFITAISAIVSLGFSIAASFSNQGEAQTMALYGSARSLALVIVAVVPFFTASTAWLLAVASGMTIVQACDAAIGLRIKDRMKTIGPAAIAFLNAAAMAWLTVET